MNNSNNNNNTNENIKNNISSITYPIPYFVQTYRVRFKDKWEPLQGVSKKAHHKVLCPFIIISGAYFIWKVRSTAPSEGLYDIREPKYMQIKIWNQISKIKILHNLVSWILMFHIGLLIFRLPFNVKEWDSTLNMSLDVTFKMEYVQAF